jgi:putative transcriptional regulator
MADKMDFENFDFFEGLKQSFEEAIAFKKGDKSKARVTVVSIPVPAYKAKDIARLRKDLRLSQRGLANVIGVSPRTVEAWEVGRSTPNGAATRMLYLFDQDNSLISKLIKSETLSEPHDVTPPIL